MRLLCRDLQSHIAGTMKMLLVMSMALRHLSPRSSLVMRCVQLAVRSWVTTPPPRTMSSRIRALSAPWNPERQATTVEKMWRSSSRPLHQLWSRPRLHATPSAVRMRLENPVPTRHIPQPARL